MRRIVIYYVITFAITISLAFGWIYPLYNKAAMGLVSSNMVVLSMSMMMFIPSIAAILTRLVTKEGLKNTNFKPVHFKQNFRYYLYGWFGPALLITLGAVVYFLIDSSDFDPSMSAMIKTLQSQLAALGTQDITAEAARSMLLLQLVLGVFASPLLNFITCLGEEWGWRGYVLPKVNERLSFIPTVLVTGALWGLWHAPVTVIGHNYGLGYPGFPYLGIFAMCCFCIAVGVFLSYLTIKSKSCIPAALAHGSMNGFAAASMMFSVSGGNPFIGPLPTGLIGGSAFLVVALIICLRMKDAPLWVSAPTNDTQNPETTA